MTKIVSIDPATEEVFAHIFDTSKILGRPPKVVIDAHSGLAGIAIWINNYYDLVGDRKIDKKDDRIKKIKEWIDNEYEQGRITVISDVEMEQLVGEFAPNLLKLRESRVE